MSSSPFSSKIPSGIDPRRPCACCLNLCDFFCVFILLYLEGLNSLMCSIHSGSYSFSIQSKALMLKKSRMTLDITLLLCSLYKTIVFGVFQGPGQLVSVSWSPK